MPVSNIRLKELAASTGVDQLGVTMADPLYYMYGRLQRRIDEGRVTPFEEKNPSFRLHPDHLLKQCRSIITLAMPYAATNHPSPLKGDEPLGKVARCARSLDYHNMVEDKALKIVRKIKTETASNFNYRILSDRSPLLERELLRNSGQGWIGENCTLINSRYGSYTALGTILIDKYIEPDKTADQLCDGCARCREACPTGALTEPFILNPYRCLSYLTQAPGLFPRELRPLLSNQIYGCDLCQEVCPHNKNVKGSPFPELGFSFFPAEPLLLPLLRMTEKEYETTINLTSAGWRGKTTLQRNTVIALGNSRDPIAVRPLVNLLKNDSRPVIRLHAAWALGRIRGPQAVYALEKSFQNDPEVEVRKEAKLSCGEE